ncbi:MAG TPA: ABC transporter substrate-binding protein [Chloroflexota bacterium]|nr:ABC transporter substrate-binding protein [Chloroflexota bacterium]
MQKRNATTSVLITAVAAFGFLAVACQAPTLAGSPIRIGLVAPLSGDSATAGEAVERGMLLAIDELNKSGGVLGRPLEVVARDVANDPEAGVTALRELAAQQHIVALFGSKYSPVIMAQVDALHDLQVPLIDVGGSLQKIVENGHTPNYAFRVSMNDADANEFLARYAHEVVGSRRVAIVAVNNLWGEANAASLADWLTRQGTPATGSERINEGATDVRAQLARLRATDADALILAGSAPEGAAVVRGLVTLGWKVPVLTTWSVSGGDFVERAGVENTEGVLTLQTFSFFGQLSPKAASVLQAYHTRFGTRSTDEVPNALSVAQAYDGLHMLAQAIQKAGSTDGPRVRDALEQLDPQDGLVAHYAPPFTATNHEALRADSYLMAIWQGGQLLPAPQPRLR